MASYRSFRPRAVTRFLLATALSLGAGTAGAEGVQAAGYGYAPAYGYRSGYGFADEAVRGAYIGTRFGGVPSPNRIVPAPWSYGTYGVPTLSGIREAPVAAPSLTVINPGVRPAVRHSPGARILSRDRNGDWASTGQAQSGNGATVISVSVPRR